MQHDFMFRRLAKDKNGGSTLSRIDRVYTSLHPTVLEEFRVQVAVRGGWERALAASNHKAVTVRLDRRVVPGRRRLFPFIAAHPVVAGVVSDEEEEEAFTRDITDPNIRYRAIASNADATQRRIMPRVSANSAGTPQYIADGCLAIYRFLRAGAAGRAVDVALEVESPHRCVCRQVRRTCIVSAFLC